MTQQLKKVVCSLSCLMLVLTGITQPSDTPAARIDSPLLHCQAQIDKGRDLEATGHAGLAIDQFTLCLPIARQLSRGLYSDALKYMALAQKRHGNNDSAVLYYERYMQQQDTLNQEKIARTVADLKAHYQATVNQQPTTNPHPQQPPQVPQKKDASLIRLLQILLLAALGLIFLLLYLLYRHKEKTKDRLRRQNDQLDTLGTMEYLLLWSKSQRQHFIAPQFHPTDISALVEKQSILLQRHLQEQGLRISNEVPDHFTPITDESFVSIILRSLLQNAITYSPDNSTITIRGGGSDLRITHPAPTADAHILNALLHESNNEDHSAGPGLQIAHDLAAIISVEIAFAMSADGYLTALVTWED